MISDKELSAIRKRVEKAAKGPWKAFIEGRDMDCGSSFIRTQENDIELIGATEADYDMIANAGQDILRQYRTIIVRQVRSQFFRQIG